MESGANTNLCTFQSLFSWGFSFAELHCSSHHRMEIHIRTHIHTPTHTYICTCTYAHGVFVFLQDASVTFVPLLNALLRCSQFGMSTESQWCGKLMVYNNRAPWGKTQMPISFPSSFSCFCLLIFQTNSGSYQKHALWPQNLQIYFNIITDLGKKWLSFSNSSEYTENVGSWAIFTAGF